MCKLQTVSQVRTRTCNPKYWADKVDHHAEYKYVKSKLQAEQEHAKIAKSNATRMVNVLKSKVNAIAKAQDELRQTHCKAMTSV